MAKILIGTFFQKRSRVFGMLLQDENTGIFSTFYNASQRKYHINARQALHVMASPDFTSMSPIFLTEEMYKTLVELQTKNPEEAKKFGFTIEEEKQE